MELPEDIMAEILSRLAVKTLLRFKCVCRHWRTLISSRSFADLHLNRSVSNPTILVHGEHCNGYISQLDPVSFAFVDRSNLALCSFGAKYRKSLFVGSINGLVCLENNHKTSILILNPSTRFVKEIPTKAAAGDSAKIGFGWDPTANDYKIFRLCFCDDAAGESRSRVEVWSANLQYWREYEVNRKIIRSPSDCNNLTMDGFTYCLVADIEELPIERVIACFDVRNEALRLLPLPEPLLNLHFFFMNWKGTFALGVVCVAVYQVWTMDDDRIGRECWSKKCTFRPIDNVFQYHFATSINETQVILGIPGLLILYNLETRETRTNIQNIERGLLAYYYVENLLSI